VAQIMLPQSRVRAVVAARTCGLDRGNPLRHRKIRVFPTGGARVRPVAWPHLFRFPLLEDPMQLSARNQLTGTVSTIDDGAVMTIVKVDLGSGQSVTASVTKEAVADLGLSVGSPVTAIIKSTEVMLGVE
jgi:molybdate transport system regulatory protein